MEEQEETAWLGIGYYSTTDDERPIFIRWIESPEVMDGHFQEKLLETVEELLEEAEH